MSGWLSTGIAAPVDSAKMLELLTDKCVERNQKYKTSVVQQFENLENVKERTVIGMFSRTYQVTKRRHIHELNAIDYCGYPQTRTEVTRDFLDLVHPNRLRAKGWQAEQYKVSIAPPTLARIGRWGDCVYVDLKSAYWSILNIIGWDVEYTPGKWILPGRVPYDFPLLDDKIARICLVSAGLNAPTRVWTGTQIIQVRTGNSHLNLGLWLCTQHILHAIAKIADSLGAVHIHTDGYIVPRNSAQTLIDYISEFGLVGRVKGEGNTIIHGIGSYQCGATRTKNLVKPVRQYYNTIQEVDTRFIRNRLSKLAQWRERTGLVTGGRKSTVD